MYAFYFKRWQHVIAVEMFAEHVRVVEKMVHKQDGVWRHVVEADDELGTTARAPKPKRLALSSHSIFIKKSEKKF